MKERLRRLLKRSKWAVVANFVVRNRRARRSVETDIHGQSRGLSVSESVDYVERAFEAIMGHGRLSPADIEGKRVLELGPGDNLGLALRFLAAGARQVVTLDKFAVLRDPGVEQEIYRSLLARLSPKEQARCGSAVCFGERTSFDDERLRPVSGVGVEEALTILEPESFDLIVSVAVLEHVYNPDASFAAMDRLLKPGGRMLHQVDFRDHEMFSGAGHHPLTFLTVPQRIWRAMTYDMGGPNRHLIDYYRAMTASLGYDTRLLVNQVIGLDDNVEPRDALGEGVAVTDTQRELIASIRPRLQPPFRELSDADLTAAGVFMVARKPERMRAAVSAPS